MSAQDHNCRQTKSQVLPVCDYRGEHVGERDCPACAGRVRKKEFECFHPQRPPRVILTECGDCDFSNEKAAYRLRPVILFTGPREVAEGVRGWHLGYDRDKLSGIDKGLTAYFSAGDRNRDAMIKFMDNVQSEAARIENGVCVVWHPAATVNDCEQFWKGPVFAIEAKTVKEAEEKWAALKSKLITTSP